MPKYSIILISNDFYKKGGVIHYMNNYDICIIGAGPCGLTLALELSKKYKLCIIEAGREYRKRICPLDTQGICKENCNPCNIITGFGGCQFIDGTKACFYPAGTGLFNFNSKDEVISNYNYIENLLVKYGKPVREQVNEEKKNKIINDFNKHNIEVKYYNAQKVDKDVMQTIGIRMREELIKNSVDFFYDENVYNIEKNKDFTIFSTSKVIKAKKVVLATGRYGGLFLNKLSEKLKIEYEKNNFIGEIGVRIEMPYNIFNSIDNVFNDIKLKRKIDELNEMRSFCQNYKGIVRKCVFDTENSKMSSLDGCILGPDSNNTQSINIAIHHRKKDITEIEKFKNMIIKANKDGKPIAQNMDSFLNNTSNCNFDEKYCTMKDYVIDNANKYLPEETLNYIKEMIIDIDKVLPGFADKNNIVYAPSFELGGDKYKLSKGFETNIEGLYIGGDACGFFRGLMQAMVSGKIISDDIIKKMEV